ncbi:hypothetical protein OEZ85_002439 [Tetradesmus obliquus]|uniref:K Homology domain-containing protein n=1 Tax=Tetradesmus obliquus TaxID=3088 RepID=A0ABY8TXI0_TETOB|nr:hypothetical protein OEZ85_002439 [Tetradesmus obliquus]
MTTAAPGQHSGPNLKPTLNGNTTADTSSHHPPALDQNNNAHAPAAAAVNGVIPHPAGPGASSSDGAGAAARAQQQQQQQGVLYDAQGSPLPEAAPTAKTDPVELSLLASYLQIVRQTQGDAAAAEAMAASGMTDADGSAPTPFSAAAAAGVFAGGSSAAEGPGPAAAGGSAEEQLAVNNLLGFIKQRKLAGQPPPSSHGRRSSSGSVASVGSAAGGAGAGGSAALRKIWIQPSGPRRPGEGVEDEEQGILSAEEVPATGEVMMRITLLAAGFVIGPSGSSVREVVRLSGAEINSWTEAAGSHRGRRPARIFVIKGEARCVAQAIYIVTAAVDRYKELCEGRYSGQSVPRSQNVLGVTFSYQPPPKSIVPSAASLKELYGPPHSIANAGKYASSPPGFYNRMQGARQGMPTHPAAAAGGFHGGPRSQHSGNPADPNTWAAMMAAAASMGFNPLAALAAAAGNPAAAAAAGMNPYAAAAFHPYGAAGLNMMGGGGGGFGNPMAAAAGYGGGQNPGGGFSDQSGMGGLNPMAAVGPGGGMNPAMFGGHGGFMGTGGADMAGSDALDSKPQPAAAPARQAAAPTEAATIPSATGSSASQQRRGPSAGRQAAPAAAGGAWPPPLPFPAAPPGAASHHHLAPLMVPAADPAAGTAADPAAGSPTAAAANPPAGSAAAGASSPGSARRHPNLHHPHPHHHPAAAGSPGRPMLGLFGPLFHPMSPGAAFMTAPYGVMPGVPPFVPAAGVPPSPMRIMRDKSGQAVPYVEMGGTVYFAPASPMPPAAAAAAAASGGAGGPSPAASGRGEFGGGSGGGGAEGWAGSSSGGGGGMSTPRSGGRGRRGGSRPQSGHTPLRVAGAALRLLEDNPYLVQDTIGSGAGHYGQQQQQRNSPQDERQYSQQQQQYSGGGGSGGSRDTYAYDMAAYDAAADMGGHSPSMNQLSPIPETHSAATSPAGNGSSAAASRAQGGAGRPGGVGSAALAHLHQLNAQDPIVSPGRINLASKVKAARLYSSAAANVAAAQAAAAAAGGYGPSGSPGSSSE